MRIPLLLVTSLTVSPVVSTQQTLSLDTPSTAQIRITDPLLLRRCDLGALVAQIGHAVGVPVGFENTRDCPLGLRGNPDRNAVSIKDLSGLSIRQAFDYLITAMPDFSWRAMQGVIVVRPTTAWQDPSNVLNVRTAAFQATNTPFHDVVHTLLRATPEAFLPHRDVPHPERPIDRPLSMVFPGGTLLQALNAIVRARGDVDWKLAYAAVPGWADLEFGTTGSGGGVVMAPVAIRRTQP